MGSNFRLHSRMKKILFWFGVLIVSLMVMIQPARASGTVAAVTNYTCAYYSAPGCPNPATGDLAHFQGFCASLGANYEFVPNVSGKAYMCRKITPWANIFGINVLGSSCPPNSTGSPCTCTDPYIPNAGATACVMPACPAFGAQADAYWISTGTVANSIYSVGNGTFCKNACQVKSFVTVPRPAGYPKEDGAVKLVDGVRQFYSFREYMYTGQSCSAGDAAVSAAATIPASDTCAANQSMIQMGTRIKCIDPATGAEVNPNSASAVAAAKTLADAKIAAQIAAAGAAVAAAGGSASDVVAAGTVAAGVAAAGGSAGASPTGFAPDDPMNAFCVQNPQATICKEQTAGEKSVGTAALSGLYTDGTLNGGKTVSSVIGAFKTRVLASGVGAAVGGFFTVNQTAGACPVWSVNAPMVGALTFDFYCQSTFQNLLPWIRSVLLLIFSVIAFRIAVL